jgi:predicted GNAT superfamily acetyltransferase
MHQVVNVRLGRDEDLSRILAINRESRPGVAALDATEFRHLLSNAAIVLVADVAELVHGYLIAFADSSSYRGEEFLRFREILESPFMYIDQVAVQAQARRRGVANRLYDQLVASGARDGIRRYCCEVNIEPPNPASMRFHTAAGFVEIGQLTVTNERRVALLLKQVQAPTAIES